jgi:hypothetical protein
MEAPTQFAVENDSFEEFWTSTVSTPDMRHALKYGPSALPFE